ncbi:calcium-binding protein [Roseibium aggregatum]|uniref:calcium-binding protein n=1 Tax=Roseibium aggregatum TaxID=187304 RepID=UPI00226C49F6|nr:calcium-binding protein [Roseibium aggregatum]UES54002.1 hypothetical protein GFK88_29925 [Roseibium aggregatum]
MSNGIDIRTIADLLLSDGYAPIVVGNTTFEVRYQAGYIHDSLDQTEEAINVITTISSFISSPTGSLLVADNEGSIFVNITNDPQGPESGGGFLLGQAIVNINTAEVGGLYLDTQGNWQEFNLQHIVNHELLHVLGYPEDDDSHNNMTNAINGETYGGPPRYSYEDVIGNLPPRDYCFAAGTLVTLADGSKRPIEQIQIGDRVAAFLETEKVGVAVGSNTTAPILHNPLQVATVTELIRNTNQKLIEVNGVKVTPGHRFYCADGEFREIGTLNIGDLLVDVEGNPVPITSIKDVPGLHDTYNLTVADFHTYVAGGYRVHNDSLFYPQSEEGMLIDSIMDQVSAIIFDDNPWGDILIGSAMRSIGSVTADVLFGDDEFSAEILLGRYAINVIGGVGGYAARMLVEEAGEELGLPDEVTGALSIFANQAGTELAEYAALTFIAEVATPGSALSNEATEALANQNVGAFLQGAAVAAIGSFAAQQLAELIGIDDEYSAFLTAPTRATVTQIGNNIADGIPWHTNVANVALNALGSVAGAFLANEIGQFDTYTEQLGSSIGSAIGSQIGQFLIPIPFVGAFLGSLVGGLIGGYIGGLFGDDPVGYAEMAFDTATDSFYISAVYGEDKNAEQIAKDVAESAEDTIESLLETINGDVLNESISTRTFEYDDGDFALERNGDRITFGEDAERMINRAVVEILAELKIAGGDPYLKRALSLTLERIVDGEIPDHEQATSGILEDKINTLAPTSVLNQLQVGDLVSFDNALSYLTNSLIVAQEYKKYLENIQEINALIAADPESEFAIGWQITLAQAFNLGLHRRHESDWNGGWDWWLGDKDVSADDVRFRYLEGERWFLTGGDADFEVTGDSIAHGEKDTIGGTDGADIIAVNHDRYATSSSGGEAGAEIGMNGTVQDDETLIGFAARLKGGDGDDLIIGGDLGNDLFGEAGNDKLIGGALDDWLYGGSGDDILISGGGNGNVLDGGDGNDRVFGSDGEDWLIGGDGNDVLRGAEGNDILDAGAGRDQIDGGQGDDTYVFRPGDGLTIMGDSGQDAADKLLFGDGIDPADLTIARADNGLDLVITFANGEPGDKLVLRGMLTNGHGGIDLVRFSNGIEWDRGAIIAASIIATAQGLTATGTSADETIEGSNYSDDLSGGAGADILEGGEGSDVYRFNRGDGQDEIVDRGMLGDIDRVVFGSDIALTDLSFERSQDSVNKLIIRINNTTDTLAIDIRSNGWGDGVEFFQFADGTELSLTDINRIYLGHNTSDGDDLILGFDSSEVISTGDGNDTLSGGRGNDYLLGGVGDDTYLFQKGDGYDIIDDALGADVLQFGDGIGPDDIRLSASLLNERSLILEVPGSGDRVEIINGLDNTVFDTIEQIKFADGTIWTIEDVQQKLSEQSSSRWSDYVVGTDYDDVISTGDDDDRVYGHDGDDLITGGKGDDVLFGGHGSDTYYYDQGDGRDVIHTLHSSDLDVDRIVFGQGITTDNIKVDRLIRNLDLRITLSNGDWLTILSGGESRNNYYINEYEFADGTILDREGFYNLARATWTSGANDIVHGFSSDDIIDAGSGDDRVYGNHGEDEIRGGAGRDELIGGDGTDTYVYNLGDGIDTIFEGHISNGEDVLAFGAGISMSSLDVERTFRNLNIRITLEDGNWITIDEGGETRWNTGLEILRFADGTELSREEFYDLARATWTSSVSDIVHGFNSADVLEAGDGNDFVYGNRGEDDITGSTGDDILSGGADGDTYRYDLGDGNDTIVEGVETGIDTLIFGAGITTDNILVERTGRGQNFRISFETGEWILIREMAETRWGNGIEEFQFADGTVLDRQQFYDLAGATWTSGSKDIVYGVNWTDVITGAAGDDRLNGYGGSDHLTGGLGNDYLAGGSGADSYYFNLGDGYDIIWDEKISGGSADTLVLGAGITAEMISVVRVPWHSNSVRLNLGNGDAIQLIDQLGSYDGGVETIVFADGTVWTADDIANAISSSGSTATGGPSDDEFNYTRGDGLAYFDGGSGDDHINFSNVGLSEIDFGFDPKDTNRLTLSVRGTNDEVSLLSIETVSFDGGGDVSLQNLWNQALAQHSTAGDDYLIGSSYGDTISTGDGDDVILSLHGDDLITGGKGNDQAFGSWGDDTYTFGLGDGIDYFDGGFDNDTVSFGSGITLSDLELSYDITDPEYLMIAIQGTSDRIGIDEVENIRFSDGCTISYASLTQMYVDQNSTSGDDYINAFDTSETISAGAGNDQIFADHGDDTIIGGTGDDYAIGGWGNDIYIFSRGDGRDVFDGDVETDTLRFGPNIASTDVTAFTDVTDASYVTFAISGTFDQISIVNVERIEFSDRTLNSQTEIYQFFVDKQVTAGDDYISSFETSEIINSGAGDDQIYADEGDDQISGGTGDDYVEASHGNDTYTFNLGDGRDIFDGGFHTDTLIFGEGIAYKDILLGRDELSNEMISLSIAGTTDVVTIKDTEIVQFADGTSWTINELYQRYVDQVSTSGHDRIFGFAGSQTIDAGTGDDWIDAGSGNDTIRGRTGNDHVLGGLGNDVYIFERGDGNDVFEGGLGTDIVRFGAGISLADLVLTTDNRNSNFVLISISGSNDSVSVKDVSRIEFSDGSSVSFSSLIQTALLSSDSTIDVLGTVASDQLVGTSGDDQIVGHGGDDTLIGGQGSDTYRYSLGDGSDRIVDAQASGIDVLDFAAGISPNDVRVLVSPADASDLIIEILTDGSQIILVGQLASTTTGIEEVRFADNTVWNRSDLTGAAESGDATIGGDVLYGSIWADTLDGDKGNDVLRGGLGNDDYFFELGDGEDVIEETGGDQSIDRVMFGTGIVAQDLQYSRVGNQKQDLLIHYSGADQILVKNQFEPGSAGITSIVLFDGSQIDISQIQTALLASAGTANTDEILGFDGADTLQGLAGDDTLDGRVGGDTYLFNSGDGHDIINDTGLDDSVDTLLLGDGISASDVRIEQRQDGTYVLRDEALTWSVSLLNLPERPYGGLETIEFEDGTIWQTTDLEQLYYATSTRIGGDGQIFGNSNDNTIVGGDSDETIYGYRGDDTLIGGEGADILLGGDGNDTLIGGMGNDTLEGGLGLDSYDGSEGEDTVTFEYSAADWIVNLAAGTAATTANPDGEETLIGIENIRGSENSDAITGDGAANKLFGNGGADTLIGGAGDDLLDGGADADALTGGVGNDLLQGAAGNDTYLYSAGDGQDSIREKADEGAADVLILGPGLLASDILVTQSNDDVADVTLSFLDGGSVTLEDQFASPGEIGVEIIRFDDGTEWTKDQLAEITLEQASTAGDDTIRGFNDRGDIINGGAGNDTINGGAGDDNYVYNLGDGNDVLTELTGNGNVDKLILGTGIEPDTLQVFRENSQTFDAYVVFPDGSWIVLTDQYRTDADIGIEFLEFQDGTVWNKTEIEARTTFNAKPTAVADSFEVLLDGPSFELAGETILSNDTDDGVLTLLSATSDANGTVELTPEGNLVVTPVDGFTGDMVITYTVSDGFFQTVGTITVSVSGIVDPGTDDNIVGTDDDDLMFGGKGDDTLNGGKGDDTYVYRRGDGHDTITESTANGSNDILQFTDIDPEDVTLIRNNNDVTIVIAESSSGAGDGGSVLLKSSLSEYYYRGIEKVVFSDNTVWTRGDLRDRLLLQSQTDGNDIIDGFADAETITGGLGDDTINGQGGSDTYIYRRGDGHDTISEGTSNGSNDTLVFTDITPGDISLVRNNNDVTIVISESAPGVGDAGSVLLKSSLNDYYDSGIDRIQFADNTVWTRADLRALLLEQSQTSGDDVIEGFKNADTITGGLGNDTLNGQEGNDTYVYRRGDGHDTISEAASSGSNDTLVLEDINPNEVSVSLNGNDVTIVISESTTGAGDGGSVLLKSSLNDFYSRGVEEVVFADGTVWNRADFVGSGSIIGTSGNDTLQGTDGEDEFDGGQGDDSLFGKKGSDVYQYALGDGSDFIDDEDGSTDAIDVLQLTDINSNDVELSRSGVHAILKILATGDTITFDEQFYDARHFGIDQISFADAVTWDRNDIQVNAWYRGSDGSETLQGTVADENFVGGLGDDTLLGKGGSDVYHYAQGDGSDLIDEGADAGTDVLKFADLNVTDLEFSRGFGVGDVWDLGISVLGTLDRIKIDDAIYDDKYGIERYVFADGTIWTVEDVLNHAAFRGTSADETINGSKQSDTLLGDFADNDKIIGAGGDDILVGGTGSDTYVYAIGDGSDLIDEGADTGTDTLQFTDLNFSDLEFSRGFGVGDIWDLGISVLGTADRIKIDDAIYDDKYGIERFEFADGTVWTVEDVLNHAAFRGTAADDTIVGSKASDTLLGDYADNDRIVGAGGSDILTGGTGSDTFVFRAAETGHDTVTDFAAGAGSEDVLEFETGIFADMAAVIASASDDGTDTTIAIDDDTSITLQNVLVSQLHQDDFQFV